MASKNTHLELNHLGLIPDGNRRWARQNGISITKGHKKGYENLKLIVKTAVNEYGVKNISAYVFSNENWRRDPKEVKQLMKMIPRILLKEIDDLHNIGVRIRVIGSRLRLDKSILTSIKNVEEKTKNNTKCNLFLCLDYGGKQEIVDMIKKIVKSGLSSKNISEESINDNLYIPRIPPLDLIIRTSGERRLSNFMLWESAYSEMYFTEEYWPDFNETSLRKALSWFGNSARRFGK